MKKSATDRNKSKQRIKTVADKANKATIKMLRKVLSVEESNLKKEASGISISEVECQHGKVFTIKNIIDEKVAQYLVSLILILSPIPYCPPIHPVLTK